nr:reverse transcriptase domain-containing protein [Tanacetum cinerariifolium]
MTRLLEKDTTFIFSPECVDAFQTLKRKLIEAPILIAPDWDMPFELICDVSDFVIGSVLGKRQDKHFRPIHYASKTMTEVESNYTMTEKEMLAVVACHLSRKANSLKMLSIISGMTPICLKSVLIKSSEGVYLVRKPLTSSRLATLDQPDVTMDQITQPKSQLGLPPLQIIQNISLVWSLNFRQLSAREVDHFLWIQGSFFHAVYSSCIALLGFSTNHTCLFPTMVDDCQHLKESLCQ